MDRSEPSNPRSPKAADLESTAKVAGTENVAAAVLVTVVCTGWPVIGVQLNAGIAIAVAQATPLNTRGTRRGAASAA